jgi:hypothetical protein
MSSRRSWDPVWGASRARVLNALVAYVPFVLVLAALAPIIWPTEGTGDTFYFWYAGHLVVTGSSPYDPSAWSGVGAFGNAATNVVLLCTPPTDPSCLWSYPPLTAWLFAPFALFDAHLGVLLLNLFLFITAGVSLVMLAHWMRARSAITRALALSAFVASEPFVFDVHAGHFDGLGIIGLLLVCGGLNSGRAVPVAAGALLLSLKPHMYVLVAIVVLALVLRERRWRVLAATTLTLAIVSAAALARDTGALTAMISGASAKVAEGNGWAATWAFAGSFVPDSPLVGYALVFAIGVAAMWTAVRNAPRGRQTDALVAGSAALSLTLPPYLSPYDLMLTFPTLALSLAIAERLAAPSRAILQSLIVFTLAIGTWVAIGMSHLQNTVHGLPGALPILALVYLAIASAMHAHRSRDSERSAAAQLARGSTA